MIPYQRGNGKTVMLTFEQWLNLTDEKIQDLIADNEGYEIDNPFDKVIDRARDYEIYTDIPKDLTPDIPEELDIEDIKKIEGEKK